MKVRWRMQPRIRTVKPELFQHEELYKLEKSSRLPVRFAFAGLFTVCDREGRFEWKPNIIKLHILPWDKCDMGRVLDLLAESQFIWRYSINGSEFGCVPNFKKHQVINAREAKSRIPAPPCTVIHVHTPECMCVHVRAHGEQNRIEGNGTEQNRTGREGKGCGEGKGTEDAEIQAMQAELEARRLREGLNADGTEKAGWGRVSA